MKQYIFEHNNKQNWGNIKSNLFTEVVGFAENFQKDFQVQIDKYKPKKSSKQLRSYWMLINSVKQYMKDQGNNFTQEEISDWFKIKSDHYTKINGEKIPRSISNKSGTTVEEMRDLINTILEFGHDHNIQGCYIDSKDLNELLTQYEEKNGNGK